jgi:hypothetical protein
MNSVRQRDTCTLIFSQIDQLRYPSTEKSGPENQLPKVESAKSLKKKVDKFSIAENANY